MRQGDRIARAADPAAPAARQVGEAARGADVGGMIEFVENFPLSEAARSSLRGEVDEIAQQILTNSGIRKIQIDAPYTFEKSQQAGISAN